MLIASSSNITFATIAPVMQPATWTGMHASASRQLNPPKLGIDQRDDRVEMRRPRPARTSG